MNALLFTGFLNVQPPVPFADPTREAWRYGSKALMYELELDEWAKRYEKSLPEDVRKYAPYIGIVIRGLNEQRLSYTWSF